MQSCRASLAWPDQTNAGRCLFTMDGLKYSRTRSIRHGVYHATPMTFVCVNVSTVCVGVREVTEMLHDTQYTLMTNDYCITKLISLLVVALATKVFMGKLPATLKTVGHRKVKGGQLQAE